MITTTKGGFKLSAPWRSRGYIPHFDGELIPQDITFRLADTLPKTVVESYRRKLERRMITEIEYYELIEDYLDRNLGKSFLRLEGVAAIVEENLLHFDSIKYKLHAWVIMPNHGHVLVTPESDFRLSSIMHSMKSYTANKANAILNRTGSFWAREYYDRYIRNAKHFINTVNYIHSNPVKAKLCSKPQDWPYSSARYLAENDAAFAALQAGSLRSDV